MAINSQRFTDLCSTLKQDIGHLEGELPRLQYLLDQIPRSTARTREETALEIRRLEDGLQEVARKSLLNNFQLQLTGGQNSDYKLICRNMKRNLDRTIEKFCNLHTDVELSLQKYCPQTVTYDDEESEVQLRKKTGTFSSIQEEVDNATELMREGVDHVLTRNSVIYTHTNFDQSRESERFDTTNLQRCYRTLVAKKRSLMETDDKDLSEKQRETKKKLVRDINELTRMYDDLQTLVDEQVAAIDTIATSVDGNSTIGLSRAKKKCTVM